MDNLCVDLKRKNVKYEQFQKRFNVLRTRSGKGGLYILEEDTLKKFNEIIAKRQNQEKSVNEKVEALQSEVEKLEQSIRTNHEEIKKMIQEFMTADRNLY